MSPPGHHSDSVEDFEPGRFNLSRWAIEHPALMRFFIVLTLLVGVFSYLKLGQAEDPPFTFKVMLVQAGWPGATADEVSRQVSERIEKRLLEVPGMDYVQSYAKPGETTLFVWAQEKIHGQAIERVWYQARKKLNDIRAELPAGVSHISANDEFGDTFGSIYALTGDGIALPELREMAEDAQREILRLPNVGKVELFGVVPETLYVEIATQKLATLGVSPAVIADAIAQQNGVVAAGAVENGALRIPLRVTGAYDQTTRLADTRIDAGDTRLRLGDIATIRRSLQDPPPRSVRSQGQPAILVGVSLVDGGDVIALGEAVGDYMAGFEKRLPVGVKIERIHDQPQIVSEAVKLFMSSFAEALAIVLAVTFLALKWRAGLVVALSIPVVLAITFTAMWWLGIDLHRVSTGALIIALGLLVDDAIIAIEMMAHKLEAGWGRFEAATFAFQSTAFPMLTGTLVTVAAFLPIALAQSAVGEYTFSIFAVTSIALIASWVVAVVVVPYLGHGLLRVRPVAAGHDPYQSPFYKKLRAAITACVRWRWLAIAATVLALVGGIGAMQFVPKQFFPQSDRLEVLVDLWLPEGASLEATHGEALRLEALLRRDADTAHVLTYVGEGAPRFVLGLDQRLANRNFAQIVVIAKTIPGRERLIARLQKLFETDFPNVRGRAARFEYGPPAGYPVQYRLSGEDIPRLKAEAEKLRQLVAAHPRVTAVNLDWNAQTMKLAVALDQEKLKALGLSSDTVSRIVAMQLSGAAVTQFREGDKLIDVVLRAPRSETRRADLLAGLPLASVNGQRVTLGQVARITPGFEDNLIWRRDRLPTIQVRGDPVGDTLPDSVAAELADEIDAFRKQLPDGFRLEIGGPVESGAIADAAIAASAPLIVVITFSLLMLQLGSFSRSVLVVLTAPLGIVGVGIALMLTQQPMGFVALLGIISLAGMIMRNSVILVDQIRQDTERGLNEWDAIIESTVRRARPIVLTAAAAVLAMIPLSRSVFWGPMAVAVMGGLLAATVLTLFFVPALYAAWFRVRRPRAVPVAAAPGEGTR